MDPVILKERESERKRRRRTHLLCHSRHEIYCLCVALQSRVVNSVYGYRVDSSSHKVRRLSFSDFACITLEHVRSLCACSNTAWMSASNSWLANTECKLNPFTWSWVHSVCALVCFYRMQEARYGQKKIQNISESMTTLAAAPGGINMLSTDVSA